MNQRDSQYSLRQLKLPEDTEEAEFSIEHLGCNDLETDTITITPGEGIGGWFLIGATIIGEGHKEAGQICQDAHAVTLLDSGWGVAVVSDGAGSADASHQASAYIAQVMVRKAKEMLLQEDWIVSASLPTAATWKDAARGLFLEVRADLIEMAHNQEHTPEDFYATAILMIFSPAGILLAHIGDGRAGYLDDQDTWHAAMTPTVGEQVGQTVFVTSDLNAYPDLLGTSVIAESVKAFTLMSDGCEHGCWLTVSFDQTTNTYHRVNLPHDDFFNTNIRYFKKMLADKEPIEISGAWKTYLSEQNEAFRTESDDKTIIIGFRLDAEK